MSIEKSNDCLEGLFRNSLNIWADQGSLSPDRSSQLSTIINTLGQQEKRKPLRKIFPVSLAATAVVVVILFGLIPSTRSWAVDHLPMVGKYMAKWSETEKGWKWAEKNQMFQEVLALSKDKGYTFRVHRVLADPTQTTIIYSVEGSNPTDIHLDLRRTSFEGKWFSSRFGGRGDLIDGVFVGSMEFDPLPQESGTLKLVVRRIGKTEGNWDVSFKVDRKLIGDMTRTVKINKKIEVPGGNITLQELIISPTQNVVKLFYKGSGPGPDLDNADNSIRLIGPEGPVEPRGGNSHGSQTLGGNWEQEYQFDFQRLDPVPAYVTFEFSGRIYRQGETRIPLEKGKSVLTPAGQEITVDRVNSQGSHGEIMLSSSTGKAQWSVDLPEWKVQDNEGELHRATPLNASSTAVSAKEVTGVTTQELEWELPSDRTAVSLINPGYWEYQDNLGKVQINIPQK